MGLSETSWQDMRRGRRPPAGRAAAHATETDARQADGRTAEGRGRDDGPAPRQLGASACTNRLSVVEQSSRGYNVRALADPSHMFKPSTRQCLQGYQQSGMEVLPDAPP